MEIRMMHPYYLRVVLYLLLGCYVVSGVPTAKIKQGIVQGTHQRSYDNKIFSAFEGIPYAKPPVGNLRFKEPIAASGWKNTLIANKSYICPQLDETHSVIGTEDCLYLYVYVPREQVNEEDNLDVVVHIHGGSLNIGSPYEMVLPDYMMDKNLILVAINYRLGAAGFLSTADKEVFGNNGFKDQTLALKWIKDNIKGFGGNPDSVTTTGLSSGAESVQFHYISPLSRGLFHRGVSTSNAVTNLDALTLIPLKKAQQLAESVRCPIDSNKNMVECLRNKPIGALVNNTDIWFKPSVEKGNPHPFLPDIPYKMLVEKKVYDVPWVISTMSNEALYLLDYVYKDRKQVFSIYNNWTNWCTDWLDLVDYVDPDKLIPTFNKLKKFYMDCPKLTEENGFEKLGKLMNARHFHVGVDLAMRAHAAATKSPVYFYLFKFVPEDHLELAPPHAASHTIDSKLMFKFRSNPARLKPQGEKMMRLLTEFIAVYAKTGIPKIGNVTWIPLNPRHPDLNVLEINSPDNIKMIRMLELAAMKFWDSLPIKENQHLL